MAQSGIDDARARSTGSVTRPITLVTGQSDDQEDMFFETRPSPPDGDDSKLSPTTRPTEDITSEVRVRFAGLVSPEPQHQDSSRAVMDRLQASAPPISNTPATTTPTPIQDIVVGAPRTPQAEAGMRKGPYSPTPLET